MLDRGGLTKAQLMDSGEMFLGGFASGFLAKGFHIGYGLYFTTNRVIGIDLGGGGGGALGGTMAGFIDGQLMPSVSPEESDKVIGQLEGMKEFDFTKDQISRIEIKKPGLLSSGHVTITPRSGKPVKITLRHRIAYDRIIQLTRAFSPGLVSSS
ncbi:hypothetical protein AUI06_08490 [archaeon 13_2_20CM_2_52_21]|nr:MAG: hypothetical protein AUI06_08490 [archaeon 13_2_20CM_2_52_21]OLD44110.1 MAG: hypothetical protein AUI51_03710 [archaeon 13_1_40CM_2_52_4]